MLRTSRWNMLNAFSMFQRDVRNMTDYYAEFAPQLNQTHYAEEMWALFQAGELTPESVLTGEFEFDTTDADVDTVLEEIKALISSSTVSTSASVVSNSNSPVSTDSGVSSPAWNNAHISSA